MNKTLLKGNAMTNDKQPDDFDKWWKDQALELHDNCFEHSLARSAWQAALQSPSAPVQQTARRSMQEAFESSEYYFRGESPARRAENWLIWKDAWQAALAQSPSVGLNTKNGG
jgi:hypothetical protein